MKLRGNNRILEIVSSDCSINDAGSPLPNLSLFKPTPLAREKTSNVNCATERMRIIRKALTLLPRRLKDNVEYSPLVSSVSRIHLLEVYY